MSDDDKVDPTNLTLSQESELNAKAASVEGFEQKMAFETFYKAGESRTLAKVAKDVCRHVKTVQKWSALYRWVPRVKERERQAAEFLLMQRSAQEEAEVKKRHLTLIDASIGKWAKRLTDDKIRLRTVDDLQKLVQLRWELTGMAEKRVNPVGMSQGSGQIDLRLRNMDRGELQQFLYSTLKSIERVMDKKPATVDASTGRGEKMDLSLSVSMRDQNSDDESSEPIDITPIDTTGQDDLFEDDLGDIELDLNVNLDD